MNRLEHLGEAELVKRRERLDRRSLESSVPELCDFVARTLCNLGVDDSHVDGAIQKVFMLALRQEERALDALEPACLFRASTRIAAQARRRWPKRAATSASPRSELDGVLDAMAEDVREVFVLCEIEQREPSWAAATLGQEQHWALVRLRHGQRIFCSKLGVTLDRKKHARLTDALAGRGADVLRAGNGVQASEHARARTLRAVEALGTTRLLGRAHLLFSRLSLAVFLAFAVLLVAAAYAALR